MNITVVNGTNRLENKSLAISRCITSLGKKYQSTVRMVTLDNFDTLFRGTHITLDNATRAQKKDLLAMIDADILLFVVPTYHTGIPSPLKNFLDAVKVKEAFENKVIGMISCNSHNHDHGARQAAQVVNGILAFNKLHSFVVPIIPVIDFNAVDSDRLDSFLGYSSRFVCR